MTSGDDSYDLAGGPLKISPVLQDVRELYRQL
jgi:hypothetical protein